MTDQQRCELTYLYPDQCACRNHKNKTLDVKPTDGVLIEQRIREAKYEGVCVLDPSHRIEAGTPIAMVAEERPAPRPIKTLGYCCAECRKEIEKS